MGSDVIGTEKPSGGQGGDRARGTLGFDLAGRRQGVNLLGEEQFCVLGGKGAGDRYELFGGLVVDQAANLQDFIHPFALGGEHGFQLGPFGGDGFRAGHRPGSDDVGQFLFENPLGFLEA